MDDHARAEPGPRPRASLRHPIRTRAKLASSATGAVPVTVVDISEHGCKCERTRALMVGSTLSLTLPGFGPRGARVAWITEDAVGLQFTAPLHAFALQQVLAAADA